LEGDIQFMDERQDHFRCYFGPRLPNGLEPLLIVCILELPTFSRVERFLSCGGDFERSGHHYPWAGGKYLPQKRIITESLFDRERHVSEKLCRSRIAEQHPEPAFVLAYRDFSFEVITDPEPHFRLRRLMGELPDFKIVKSSNVIAVAQLAETLCKLQPVFSVPAEDDWSKTD
jgi:hypothetical protein